jgi:transposase-like protein
MTKSSRRTLNAQFKFQVALEAVKGLRSINEIAADYQMHPTQVSTWKKELCSTGRAHGENEEMTFKERRRGRAGEFLRAILQPEVAVPQHGSLLRLAAKQISHLAKGTEWGQSSERAVSATASEARPHAMA